MLKYIEIFSSLLIKFNKNKLYLMLIINVLSYCKVAILSVFTLFLFIERIATNWHWSSCRSSCPIKKCLKYVYSFLTLLLKLTLIDSCLKCTPSINQSLGSIFNTSIFKTLNIHNLIAWNPKMHSKKSMESHFDSQQDPIII